jgi:hypothetical protein
MQMKMHRNVSYSDLSNLVELGIVSDGHCLGKIFLEEQGGARRGQEEPEEPGGARRSQEEPGGARRSQEELGGARRGQEGPG